MSTRAPSCRTTWTWRRTWTSRSLFFIVVVAVVAPSAFGLSLVSSVVNAASASAHATLVKITPDSNAQLTAAPKEVVVELSEPASSSFVTFVVTTAAGVSVTNGKPVVAGSKVTQALIPLLAAGAYRVAFRVVSADGHPVAGESGFTLLAAPTTSPSTSAPSSFPLATPAADDADETPAQGTKAGEGRDLSTSTMAMVGAFGFLIVCGGLVLRLRERR